MNNQLYLIIFWMLASCGMPVSSLYQDKTVSVISAEKTEWTGGRAGVRGVVYTIKLRKQSNSTITVKTLRAEGNTIPFAQSYAGNIITVKGSLTNKNNEENTLIEDTPAGAPIEKPASQKLNPKDNWIEYTIKGSETLYKISISKFTAVESAEEPAP
jgi:hypothetical protein